MAGILFVLPALFILTTLSWIYLQFGDVPIIAGLFYGIKPAVSAIVFHATYRIGSRTLKNSLLGLIAAAAFIAIFVFNIPFPLIVFATLLWLIPITLLTLSLGWQHGYTQMAWFFNRAALLTFVGAYAVLPYVYQGAVNHYAWLSPAQMIDGLVLGEKVLIIHLITKPP